MKNQTIKVYVWTDGTYRYSEEYSEFGDSWKGDDFEVLTFPSNMPDDDIEDYIEYLVRGL